MQRNLWITNCSPTFVIHASIQIMETNNRIAVNMKPEDKRIAVAIQNKLSGKRGLPVPMTEVVRLSLMLMAKKEKVS